MQRTTAIKVLGLEGNPSPREIKSAFNKAALGTHPDQNPNDAASSSRFREVMEAYECLKGNRSEAGQGRHGVQGGVFALVFQVSLYCQNTPAVFSVPLTKEHVDAVYGIRDWVLLKYCAKKATDPEVRKYAFDKIVLERRFDDLADCLNDPFMNRETAAHYISSINSLLKGNCGISSPDLLSSLEPYCGRLFIFAVQWGKDGESVKDLIRIILDRGLAPVPIYIQSKSIRLVLIDSLVEHRYWGDLMYLAINSCNWDPRRSYDGSKPPPSWSMIFSRLEGNLDRIICDGDTMTLRYIASRSSSLAVAKKAMDHLHSVGDWESIETIARNASDTVWLMKSDSVISPSIFFQHENGVAIAKLAIDLLAKEKKHEELLKVASSAESTDAQGYASSLIDPGESSQA